MLHGQWLQLELVDGVLYRRCSGKEGKPAVLQLLVPATLRHDFITRAHTGMCGGHLGVRRTLDQVQRRGFWLGWCRVHFHSLEVARSLFARWRECAL